MCRSEGSESGFDWILGEGESWVKWPDAQKQTIHCFICQVLSSTGSMEYGRLHVTLKSLRQSSLLGCTTCQALSQGIQSLIKAQPPPPRRDSMILLGNSLEDSSRYEGVIDELVVSYQVDQNFECPFGPGGWTIRCGCKLKCCRHERYHIDFEILTLPSESRRSAITLMGD
ncbi:hypothetical protein GQ44DRAFT_41751 [Phaeosphaeriaceae sp. PMI808]|nr:hypothetical protein GQ44DRAFT_41751 [Phaeosphaeriaceae sp. PMI808]